MTTIDRTSPVPLYFQLKQILLDKIEHVEWKAGDMIPSEQELQETYGLSRTTVRQTLSEMVNQGLLDRQRGRGTFVKKPTFTHDPSNRKGVTEFLRESGIHPGWRVIRASVGIAPVHVAEKMEVSEETELFCLERLRLANEEPIGCHIAYVAPFLIEQIDKSVFEEGESLRYLHQSPYLNGSKAQRVIEAQLATADEQALLDVEIGQPILHIERIITGEDGRPLELLYASYRGDRFKYKVTL